MTHTPGPWKSSNCEDMRGHTQISMPGGSGANVYSMGDSAAVQKANARLIAAAPELLGQLKFVLDWIEGQQSIGEIHKGLDFPAVRAAIAKAEGRQ